MSEHLTQIQFFKWVRLYENHHPILKGIFAIPNGGYRHKNTAKKMKAEGQMSGVWDIFCAVPCKTGKPVWIEMKYGYNKLTEHQKEFQELLNEHYEWRVCYTWEQAVQAIIFLYDLPIAGMEEKYPLNHHEKNT